jgi:protoheme IX farnesyltransferase
MKENKIIKTLAVYADLIKFRLSLAVVFSSVAGYYLFRNSADRRLFFLATGIFLLASGSAALNQYTERIADSVMERTRNRPIPSEKIPGKTAARIASLLLLSGCIFLCYIGITPLLLGMFNVVLYNVVYTTLKKTTILSIIPGALVGAIPPIIGFSSAGGTLFHMNIIAFSVFMFLWQLPHFWLIIIKYGKEYKAAGFATISKYLNETQIKYLVFFWVLFSTVFLLLFCVLADSLNKDLIVLLSAVNIAFISFFYRMLFLKKEPAEIKGAFILFNSFGIFIMFLIITVSILKGI